MVTFAQIANIALSGIALQGIFAKPDWTSHRPMIECLTITWLSGCP